MSSAAGKSKTLRRANPSTIQDKFLVGYQGRFTCSGDGEPIVPGHHGWLHWLNHPITSGGRPKTDLWPDISEYTPSELFPVPGLNFENGDQSFLFSSRHPKTVQRHFRWMALHGVDGAFLQRSAAQIDVERGNEGIRRLRDEVGDRVREAAEMEGRVFAIMYDVSGVPPDRIQIVLERDWTYLVRVKGILDSPSYLKERGKPVIALWGFGFENSNHPPSTVTAVVSFLRNNTPGGAYIIAGTPAHWRTSSNDADRNPEFVDVWLNEFDAISPWTVGRYGNEDEADVFAEYMLNEDVELLRKRNEKDSERKVDYIPVVFPGGSGSNPSEGKWAYNDIKRNGGKFLWRQIFNARRQGVRVMYGAMWDEYDEGTALMPVVEKKRHLPKSDRWSFMALDADGYDLPPDWYMRICGFAVEGLRSERRIHESFPGKELQDYWSTRPRYEESEENPSASHTSSSGAGDSAGRSYQEWLASQKEDKDEPAPPPYSLEAEAAEEATAPQTPALTSTPASAPASAAAPTGPPPVDLSSRPQIHRASSDTSPASALPPPSIGRPITSSANSLGRPVTSSPQLGPVSAYPIGQPNVTMSPPTNRPVVSLPQPGPIPTYPSQAVAQPTTSISSLTDNFGRHGVSSPEPVPPSSPPLSTTQRPYPTPLPSNLSSGTQPAMLQPSSTLPVGSQGQWSQTQWPPPEWKTQQHHHFPRPPHHPHSGRIQTTPGPELGRPHASSMSNLAGSTVPQARPGRIPSGETSFMQPIAQPPQQTQPNAYPGEYPPQPMARPISPYPPGRTPSFPSGPATSDPLPAGTSLIPQPSPPMPSAYGQMNPYGSPPPNPMPASTQTPANNAQQSGYFDNRPGYYRPPQPYPPQQSTLYPGGHPSYSPGQPMPSGPGPSLPGPTGFPTPQSFPGHYGGPPPQHPANYSPYPPSGPPNFPSAAPTSGPLDFALTAADSLGLGGSTRQQIERVTQSGNKLLSKFL